MTTTPSATRTLGLIRIALLVGVLAFGGVVWYLSRTSDTTYPGYVAFRAWKAWLDWEPRDIDWWVLALSWLANPAI